jgi:di/tricarboxylate transporter
MSDLTITLLILAGAIVLFVWNRIPPGIVALLVALSLWATGVLPLEDVLAGFGSSTVVLIASLFVVAEGLDAAGITTWAGQQVTTHAGDSQSRLLILTMGAGALLSALITPNGATAALIPMVVVLAVRKGLKPSRMLMPLAFSTHAGSLLMLTGTPINVLIMEAAASAGERELRFFEFARVGIPLVIGTILIVVLFGGYLLPNRSAKNLPRDLSQLPQTLQRQYIGGDRLARLRVAPESTLIGMGAGVLGHREHQQHNVTVIGVQDGEGRPLPDATLGPGNVLLVRGQPAAIERLAATFGLDDTHADGGGAADAALVNPEQGVAEVLISPRSAYVGETVFPGMVTESGTLVVVSVLRHGEELDPGEVTLKAGDSMLLQGTWEALDEHTQDPNVLLVDSPDAIRRQAVPLGARTVPALVILGAMVLLLATGLVPAVVAGLAAAIAMVLSGVITVPQAHRSMSWTTLILVAGMIPLSTAIQESGAADLLAGGIVNAVGGGDPILLLVGLFLITAVLGQVISNTATALILIPIALSIAAETGLSPLPLLMAVNVAAAAALLTPIATPANLMVMGPGGYQFADYAKLGLPLLLVYLLVAVFVVPFWWPW